MTKSEFTARYTQLPYRCGLALACINAEAATLAMMMNEAANKIQAGSVY